MNKSDKPQAGPEIDALIAEKVMGLEVSREVHPFKYHNVELDKERGGVWSSPIPAYSTDIAAAWEVVKKIGKPIEIRVDADEVSVSNHTCESIPLPGWNWHQHVLEAAPTAPLAICRAALKAIELTGDSQKER